MSELESKVEGVLVKDHVLVSDKDMQHILELKGFGEIIKKKFFLKPFESLYLLYVDKLKLFRGAHKMDFDTLMAECVKLDPDSFTKFLIYRDLRTKDISQKMDLDLGQIFEFMREDNLEKKVQNMSYLD